MDVAAGGVAGRVDQDDKDGRRRLPGPLEECSILIPARYRVKPQACSAFRAAMMNFDWSRGSIPRRGLVAPSSRGHSR